jgi:chromosome segregation ATPase
MDELERPHSEKVAMMEGELEETRKQLFAARRRAEAIRAELEAAAASHAAEAEARAEAHRREMAELSSQVTTLQEQLDASIAATDTTMLRSQLAEAKAMASGLASEVSSLRGARDEAVTQREAGEAAAHRKVLEAEEAVGAARRQLAVAERRAATLEEELRKARADLHDGKTRAREAEGALARASAANGILEDRLRRADASAASQLEATKAEAEREVETLSASLDAERASRSRAEDRVRELESELASHGRETAAMVSRVRREMEARLLDSDTAQQTSEQQASMALLQRSRREMDLERRAESAEAELVDARLAKQACERSKAAAETEAREALDTAAKAEAARAGLAAALDDLKAEYSSLQRRHESLAEAERRHAAEVVKWQGQVAESKSLLEAANEARDAAVREEAALRSKLALVQESFASRARDQSDSERAAFEAALAKQRKRAAEYKRKLLQLYAKHKEFRVAAKSLSDEHVAIIGALQAEVAALQRRTVEADALFSTRGTRVPAIVGGMVDEESFMGGPKIISRPVSNLRPSPDDDVARQRKPAESFRPVGLGAVTGHSLGVAGSVGDTHPESHVPFPRESRLESE